MAAPEGGEGQKDRPKTGTSLVRQRKEEGLVRIQAEGAGGRRSRRQGPVGSTREFRLTLEAAGSLTHPPYSCASLAFLRAAFSPPAP